MRGHLDVENAVEDRVLIADGAGQVVDEATGVGNYSSEDEGNCFSYFLSRKIRNVKGAAIE